jgi:hypothetical protein
VTYDVVGACSANVGRSGIFDAVLNYEMGQQGIGDDTLRVTSAGLLIEKIFACETDLDIQLKILGAGLKYGLVRPELQEEIEGVIAADTEQQHTQRIRALYGAIRPAVHGFLKAERDNALREAGVEIFPTINKPLDPEAGYGLIIPMVEKDRAKVETKYSDAGIALPKIVPYGGLVDSGDVVDNVQEGAEGIRRRVEFFMDTRKKALERILELRG